MNEKGQAIVIFALGFLCILLTGCLTYMVMNNERISSPVIDSINNQQVKENEEREKLASQQASTSLQSSLLIDYSGKWFYSNLFTECVQGHLVYAKTAPYQPDTSVDAINKSIDEAFKKFNKGSFGNKFLLEFKKDFSLPKEWYLNEICYDQHLERLAYTSRIWSDGQDNTRIGFYDLKTKKHTFFPNIMLSNGGIGGCTLKGFNKDVLLYSCGAGDGPISGATLFGLDIQSQKSTGIEVCIAEGDDGDGNGDTFSCEPFSEQR